MTSMIPIVAVVTEDTFHALNDAISAFGEPSPALRAAMDANGWTIDAIVAGTLMKFALLDAGVMQRP